MLQACAYGQMIVDSNNHNNQLLRYYCTTFIVIVEQKKLCRCFSTQSPPLHRQTLTKGMLALRQQMIVDSSNLNNQLLRYYHFHYIIVGQKKLFRCFSTQSPLLHRLTLTKGMLAFVLMHTLGLSQVMHNYYNQLNISNQN